MIHYNMKEKIIIYAVLPRLFGNKTRGRVQNGSLQENGCGKMADFTPHVLNEIKKLGATHIWYIGLVEHATKTNYEEYGIQVDHPAVVKGKAGSPYAIKDYYDIDPDLAKNVPDRMAEFHSLISRTHKAGLKMIMDFIPNHVARQYHSDVKPEGVIDLGEQDDTSIAFSPKNNFYYIPGQQLGGSIDLHYGAAKAYVEFPAKATGNDRFDASPNITDWYETVKLNYGVDYMNGQSHHFDPIPDTWHKMLDILLFWTSKGVDGFRCDMAEMVPVDFWHWAIPQVKEKNPSIIFIAEIYNPGAYREYLFHGHFDYLYDKVGLYDTLRNITCGRESCKVLTDHWQSLDGIQTQMLNFLENHDEQRIASDFFAGNAFKALPAMIISATMNTNPVMIYFGQELGERGMDSEGFSGQDGRTTIFDYWTVDSVYRWNNQGKFDEERLDKNEKNLRQFYTTLLNLCNEEKAIREGTFFDLTYANLEGWKFNEHKQFAYLRKFEDELLLIVVNFDDHPVRTAINIPRHAFDYLNFPPLSMEAKELLTGNIEHISMMPDQTTQLQLESRSGKILKIHI